MVYPIAETFSSIQGEGTWCGTPMLFIRLAGCNVGRFITKAQLLQGYDHAYPEVQAMPFHNIPICKSFDGVEFVCDTDWKKHSTMTAEGLVRLLKGEQHVCITGGEPFIHNLQPLVDVFLAAGVMLHFETSGSMTLEFTEGDSIDTDAYFSNIWVTCCPKHNFDLRNLPFIDELKFVVGSNFNLVEAEKLVTAYQQAHPLPGDIWLQPINKVEEIDRENIQRCLQILDKHPEWRLSVQLHKLLKVK